MTFIEIDGFMWIFFFLADENFDLFLWNPRSIQSFAESILWLTQTRSRWCRIFQRHFFKSKFSFQGNSRGAFRNKKIKHFWGFLFSLDDHLRIELQAVVFAIIYHRRNRHLREMIECVPLIRITHTRLCYFWNHNNVIYYMENTSGFRLKRVL